MRNPAAVTIVLIIFGLIPIGGWIALAASLEPGGLGRSIGRALLVLFAPMPVGGLLLIGGAAYLQRAALAPRIVATIGAVILFVGAMFIAVAWMTRVGDCGPPGVCTREMIQAGLGFLYAVVHLGLIALVWRPRG